ncbi:MAG: TIGR03087 family PEP-CTERM/XrtA system glycosyltransferase [Candidatus Rokubacteria bacterium]|nr:TIGR03087 family PEP-CTERM/XrtA system glycosyltransferase [Candidatus Rokubacteria bacterium]
MKILFVCHRLPFPPSRGGKIRPFNIIRHLSRRHEVTVASLARSAEEARAGRGLEQHCARLLVETVSVPAALARMLARLPTPAPSSMGYFHSPSLSRRIRQAVPDTRFDLVFVHCAFVAPYVADLHGMPKILDFGDMDSQKWLTYARVRRFPLSLGYRLEGLKLQAAERRLAAQFDLCTCTTQAELDTLKGYGIAAATGWFPNGVDTEYFQPTTAPYDPDRISFIGRMDYYPNQECMVDFCRTTWPLIRARRPATTLCIVGAAPSREILGLGRLPGVTVTGSVPDVRPFAHASAATVAPLRIARGTQNKILEAMAMGIPTVTSPVAARGVDAEPGRHLVTASTPEEYAAALLRLMAQPAERLALGAAARARVLSHHGWARSMEMLDGLLAGLPSAPDRVETAPASARLKSRRRAST